MLQSAEPMKIAAAQTRPVKGDIGANIEYHKGFIDLAISNDADIIIFPELSLTGYEPTLAQKLATTPDDSRLEVFQAMADAGHITIGVGLPLRSERRPTISLVFFQPGRPRQVYHKRYIHWDEEPYFVGGENAAVTLTNYPAIAPVICYEIAVPEHVEAAQQNGAEIYLASVVKSVRGTEKAHDRLAEVARRYSMVVVMANCVGVCDGDVCGGRSAVWNEEGEIVSQLNEADEGFLIYNTYTKNVIQILLESGVIL